MNSEKVGKFIKEIRKKNNLTQKELADKYGVTYQAVSKWENGINLPDVVLLRQMSKDFNISIEDILDGEYKNKKNNKKMLLLIICTVILIIVLIFTVLLIKNNDSFQFKTISTSCNEFKVTGSLAYDKKNSAIYISNIEYCGSDDETIYKDIDCTLYENENNKIIEVASCNVNRKNITLKDYLKDVKINTKNYEHMCKTYTDDSFYLEVKASLNSGKDITYKIPLKIEDDC